ncbi:hypothetical protein GOV12_06140 [Candidatus Pacearchaeota archaeon]|nr:hypothetical protein [Candidatus Pacearchaeota archaeon]
MEHYEIKKTKLIPLFYLQVIIAILIIFIGIFLTLGTYKSSFGYYLFFIGGLWLITLGYLRSTVNERERPLKILKKAWDWIWNSDSIFSWIIALIIIFVVIKFIFFPVLSLIMGTVLPLAGVESSSMDHSSVKYCNKYNNKGECIKRSSDYEICGKNFDKKINMNLDKYWETCGDWYDDNGIDKDEFNDFSMKNGFAKGDIIIVWGRFKPKVGDIIIFKPNKDSFAPRPIIHRITKINLDGTYQTKGDHNEKQLMKNNNIFNTDETNIKGEDIVGKAIFKVPYLGWVKIAFVELINFFV